MFDTSQIKQRISCVEVAQRCGLPITQAGDRCVSPLREGAKNPTSFCVDDDFWYDFSGGAGGDCIDLYAELQCGGNRGEAIRELARLTGVQDSGEAYSQGWYEYTTAMNARTAFYHTQLTPEDRDYLHSRGINDESIDRLMIGRVTDGPLKGRLFLPYFKNGAVVYYATRALPGSTFPENKYMKQRRDEHCQHIPWGLQTLNRPGDTLIIAEGYFDVASFEVAGYPVLSAITGNFSRDQIPIVISSARKFSKVFIVYDNDKTTHAGDKFTRRMADLLTRNRIPFVVGTVPAPYHDISEYFAAGGDLTAIINNAQDGITYIASTMTDFDDLETFIYTVARHTKRTRMEALLAALKKTTDFDPKRLDVLFKTATTAPPETIVADELMENYRLIYVDRVGFYEYVGGVWKLRSDKHIQGYADRAYGEFSSYQRVNAACNLLKTRALQNVEFNKLPVWNFINGTLELDTGVFREHNPNDYCSVQVSYPYNPDATYRAWADFINDVTGSDPKAAEILQFIPGYALFQDCPHEKIFVLTGSGGNGKSKYLAILTDLFGKDNTSHLKPRALLDKFQLIKLQHSIINIAGEIRSDLRDVEEAMKGIASGEPVSACYKGEQFVDFVPRTKLVYAVNGQISSDDTSDGLARRLVIVDFKVQFVDFPDPDNPYQRKKNIYILDDLQKELVTGGIFNWCYEGYKLLKSVGYFTETNDQQELISNFKRASNPVLLFWEDRIQPDLPAELHNKQLYADYKAWCEENGHHPRPSNIFGMEFKAVAAHDYEPFHTKKERGYRRKK